MNQSITSVLVRDGQRISRRFSIVIFLVCMTLYERLTKTFPEICLNLITKWRGRFDPGMLCAAPQALGQVMIVMRLSVIKLILEQVWYIH